MNELSFYGFDNSEIQKGLQTQSVVLVDSTHKEVPLILSSAEQETIIKKFLDDNYSNIKDSDIEILAVPQKNKKHDIISKYNGKVYWGGLVGVLRGKIPQLFLSDFKSDFTDNLCFKNVIINIQIQSRFDVKKPTDDSKNIPGLPFFLTTLLLNCYNAFNNELVQSNEKDYFFDLLLLYIFKEKANLCAKKGLYKCYRRFEKNDDRLKGTIDIARHIKQNIGLNNGKIAYSNRENTVDNYLNHLILCAFEKLKKKYPVVVNNIYNDPKNTDFRYLIDALKAKLGFSLIDSRTIISKNLRPISHPYYIEYDELRKISLRILRDEGLSIFDGDRDDINGILIYIPDLWELYLERFLRDDNYLLYTQGKNNEPIKIFNYENNPFEYRQKTYPDFIFAAKENDEEFYFMILDAKFKPKWASLLDEEDPLSEVLEDYNKCIRDMNSINVHATGTIFPSNIAIDITKLVHGISDYNKIDLFYTFPIQVPYAESSNYGDWYKDFKHDLDITIKKIKEIVQKEKQFHKEYNLEIKTTKIASLKR